MPGSRKGIPNKTQDAKSFVARVEAMLAKGGLKGGLEAQACRFITSDDLKTGFGVWRTLLNYKYGMPAQTIAGDKDNPLQIQILTNLDLK